MTTKSIYNGKNVCFKSVLGAALFLPGMASAQTADAPAIEEVITTGSRIVRDGFDQPTPVSVMNQDEIHANAPGSISEFVMELPSVTGSTATTSSGALSNGAAGISSLDARGMGAGRTLALFDGQRSVVSSTSGAVDTNTFPQPLISRVEVVTGGASSAYGSDAVAGVINFILNKRFDGVKTSFDYGQSEAGVNKSYKFDLGAGTPFADGKGHALFSLETYEKEGTHYYAPDWAKKGYFGIINPDKSPGQPYYIVGEGIGVSAYTPGGLITSGPLRGTYFGEDGSVNQLNYGATSGQWMVGGDWEYTNSSQIGTNSFAAEDQRDSVFGRLSYEVGRGVEVFAQASYAKYEGFSYYIRPTQTGISIRSDNAFLPSSVSQKMATLGLSSFTMGTSNMDMPASGSNNVRETTRFVVGADGGFSLMNRDFTWDTYYQHGITETDELMTPTFHFARLALATDAVFHPDTGAIVCRSSLTDPGNGCVPLNRFGVNVASDAALDYVMGSPQRKQEFTQDVIAVNFSTNNLLEGWAGPISMAVGAEYREESMEGDVDPQYASGWKYGNYKVTTGEFDVAEAYIETVIPLMDKMEFNGAIRYTDYSTSGDVRTWKAGLVYAPIDDVTLRFTRSRDIRAANMGELYDAGTARTNAVNILGQSMAFVQNLQGNPSVAPEKADTLGVGLVLRPSFMPGLGFSADYYEIDLKGIIGFLPAQTVANYCYEENIQRYCDDVKYVNGVLQSIDLRYENLNRETIEGVDYELSYVRDVGPGTMSFRGLVTNNLARITDDGVRITDSVGQAGASSSDFVYRLNANYRINDWRLNLTARGISDGVLSNNYIECTSNCPASTAPNFTINDNSVAGAWYFDTNITRNMMIGDVDAELFLTVRNVFDKDPVLSHNPSGQGAENAVAYLTTNRSVHDIYGRSFRLGVRAQF